MADFCRQCSIELFGEDMGDLAFQREGQLKEGEGWEEICEGCGYTLVNDNGECIHPHHAHAVRKEDS